MTVIATGISSIEESETINQIDMVHSTPAAREESGQSPSGKLAEEPPQVESRPVSMAKPNAAPAGLRPMPKPIFDDHEQDDYDEPAYLRKKAN